MPIYEYRCADGHNFEVFQNMSDDPVTACEVCGKPVERVFHPVAVHFKGSGFYTTDYKDKAKAGAASSSDGEGGSKESKAEGGDSKGDSKSESKGSGGSKGSEGSGDSKGSGDSAAKASSGSD